MKTKTIYKFISFLLLGNLLFSTVGSHLLFKVLEKQVKAEIKSKILTGEFDKEYQIKEFTYAEFFNLEWENSKEFVIGKNIYDVVSIEFNLDIIEVVYFHDVKESNLRKNYALYLSSFLEQDSESKNLLFNFIELALTKYVLNKHYIILIHDFIKFNYCVFNISIISSIIEIPNPPPQIKS